MPNRSIFTKFIGSLNEKSISKFIDNFIQGKSKNVDKLTITGNDFFKGNCSLIEGNKIEGSKKIKIGDSDIIIKEVIEEHKKKREYYEKELKNQRKRNKKKKTKKKKDL